MEYGMGDVSGKSAKHCGRKCFLVVKNGTFSESLLEQRECQQEEHWMEKKKRRGKKRESGHRGEVMEWRSVGGGV